MRSPQIKLTVHRDKARTHLRDLIEVGGIDSSLTDSLSPLLAERLERILDDPNG